MSPYRFRLQNKDFNSVKSACKKKTKTYWYSNKKHRVQCNIYGIMTLSKHLWKNLCLSTSVRSSCPQLAFSHSDKFICSRLNCSSPLSAHELQLQIYETTENNPDSALIHRYSKHLQKCCYYIMSNHWRWYLPRCFQTFKAVSRGAIQRWSLSVYDGFMPILIWGCCASVKY